MELVTGVARVCEFYKFYKNPGSSDVRPRLPDFEYIYLRRYEISFIGTVFSVCKSFQSTFNNFLKIFFIYLRDRHREHPFTGSFYQMSAMARNLGCSYEPETSCRSSFGQQGQGINGSLGSGAGAGN